MCDDVNSQVRIIILAGINLVAVKIQVEYA